MTDLGFISIRNEDGTSWLHAPGMWGPRAGRRAHDRATFVALQAREESSKRNDCPDNGFFGLWNLTWTPASEQEAAAAEITAAAFDAEMEAEDARLESLLTPAQREG